MCIDPWSVRAVVADGLLEHSPRFSLMPEQVAKMCIRDRSWVVTGAEQSAELHKFLLEANLSVRFGAFAVDQAGDIAFTHAILGEGLTTDALMFTVVGVAQIADEYDDLIVQRFGGQRASDRG